MVVATTMNTAPAYVPASTTGRSARTSRAPIPAKIKHAHTDEEHGDQQGRERFQALVQGLAALEVILEMHVFQDEACREGAHDWRKARLEGEVGQEEAQPERERQDHAVAPECERASEQPRGDQRTNEQRSDQKHKRLRHDPDHGSRAS